ncbi:glycosyltransferase [Membranihabitans maritimus]|uniref:glycosyltransferase n=1 Tax=Membranihabitans maritimus TaxID=2904244 RepID=UPI001F24ED3A|nr:glycosyltransferase [Membranihabitans maritimus]
MKILLFSIGTRGDMEPFLTIGEILKNKGHQVICVFANQFEDLVRHSGLEFIPLGPETLDLLESKDARIAFGGKQPKLIRVISSIKMGFKFLKIRKKITQKEFEVVQKESPDLILHNALNIYPFIWGFRNNRSLLVSAVPFIIHSVNEHPYISFHTNLSPFLNKLSYRLTNWGLAYFIKKGYSYLKIEGKKSNRAIRKAVLDQKMVFTISTSLFSRPRYWKSNVQILGFHERNKSSNWSPSTELISFLSQHKKILFITFGSITNPDPEGKTRIFMNILKQHNIPAIINTASGGLSEPSKYNHQLFHFTQSIPYDWILPQVYAIIHHGGSGTTHTALKYGLPTMITPHIFDQFTWNNIISDKALGPKGISIKKISEENLEPKVLDLFNNKSFKENAERIAVSIKNEDYEELLYQFLIEPGLSHEI